MFPNKGSSLADGIIYCIILLMTAGIIFVFSASANIGSDIDLRNFYQTTWMRQILYFPLAVVCLLAAAKIDYRKFSLEKGLFKSPVFYLLIIAVILLAFILSQRIFAFAPKIVPMINKHYRWIKIPLGPATTSFQPSELAKWATVIFLAGISVKLGNKMQLFKKSFVPICAVIAVEAGLIVVEDLGTAIFIAILSFVMLAAGGARWRHLLIPVPFAAAAIFIILILYPHRMQRIVSFLNPSELADSSNYQANQSLIALGSGGLFGKGLGRGICKYGHLPEDTTDFIFAIVGEEFGFVGTTTIIVIFMVFVWLGLLVVKRCTDSFGKLLATGIVLTIGLQAAINIGVVTVVLPTKGIPLPFVSAGGTSMLLSAAAVGILINIAKQIDREQVEIQPLSEIKQHSDVEEYVKTTVKPASPGARHGESDTEPTIESMEQYKND
jgi:cell division protein FtsW